MPKKKPHLSLVVIGHVGSGKSTILGHMIYKCGGIDKSTLDKIDKETLCFGNNQFKFSWVLDKTRQERERGLTIDIALWKIETPKYEYSLIDTPGYRNFIKNMIAGISQADVALLIVSACTGEFEAGFSKDGQTREHALLAFTLGLKQIIVGVNKMDDRTVNFEKNRFEEIKIEMKEYLKRIGYNPAKIPFVPISGWQGDNLIEPSSKMDWYKEPTLLQCLEAILPPKRLIDQPLRIPISNAYKIKGVGTIAIGKVETGVLKAGMFVSFAPVALIAEVISIEMYHETIEEAIPGDIIGFNLKGLSAKNIKRGYVCGNVKDGPPREIGSFLAQVLILNHPNQIKKGYCPVLYCHTAQIACKFQEIKQKIDKCTGEVIQEQNEYLRSGEAAIVQLVPSKPMCVETFQQYPLLGRFAIRDLKQQQQQEQQKKQRREKQESRMKGEQYIIYFKVKKSIYLDNMRQIIKYQIAFQDQYLKGKTTRQII